MSRATPRCRGFGIVVLAAAGWLVGAGAALGTSYDTSPRPVVLLADAARFVAQDGWDSVALYRVGGAAPVRRFPAPGGVNDCGFSWPARLRACLRGP